MYKFYTSEEVAKQIKRNEAIYIGNFDQNGKEYIANKPGELGCQKWTGKSIQRFKDHPHVYKDIYFVKCVDGYKSVMVSGLYSKNKEQERKND